ncbi:hypothetical protein KR044_000983 [Drosophila immigrans]|nr:hypothetical protein KR044_000983 [Drosophila immigrans]
MSSARGVADADSRPRPSNVRQLIRMFEQLTGNGAATSGGTNTLSGDDPGAQMPAKEVAKVLTLLVNGRRVAQTVPLKHKAGKS